MVPFFIPLPDAIAATTTEATTVHAMPVIETAHDGLKREFKVVVASADLKSRLKDRLLSLKERIRINDFRPWRWLPPHRCARWTCRRPAAAPPRSARGTGDGACRAAIGTPGGTGRR